MRIFFQKMVLDFPGEVDAEFVGELDLIERLLKQPVLGAIVPRPRQLMLVENAEFHGRSPRVFRKSMPLDLIRGWIPFLRSEYAQNYKVSLLAELSSLAVRVASAFWPEYG